MQRRARALSVALVFLDASSVLAAAGPRREVRDNRLQFQPAALSALSRLSIGLETTATAAPRDFTLCHAAAPALAYLDSVQSLPETDRARDPVVRQLHSAVNEVLSRRELQTTGALAILQQPSVRVLLDQMQVAQLNLLHDGARNLNASKLADLIADGIRDWRNVNPNAFEFPLPAEQTSSGIGGRLPRDVTAASHINILPAPPRDNLRRRLEPLLLRLTAKGRAELRAQGMDARLQRDPARFHASTAGRGSAKLANEIAGILPPQARPTGRQNSGISRIAADAIDQVFLVPPGDDAAPADAPATISLNNLSNGTIVKTIYDGMGRLVSRTRFILDSDGPTRRLRLLDFANRYTDAVIPGFSRAGGSGLQPDGVITELYRAAAGNDQFVVYHDLDGRMRLSLIRDGHQYPPVADQKKIRRIFRTGHFPREAETDPAQPWRSQRNLTPAEISLRHKMLPLTSGRTRVSAFLVKGERAFIVFPNQDDRRAWWHPFTLGALTPRQPTDFGSTRVQLSLPDSNDPLTLRIRALTQRENSVRAMLERDGFPIRGVQEDDGKIFVVFSSLADARRFKKEPRTAANDAPLVALYPGMWLSRQGIKPEERNLGAKIQGIAARSGIAITDIRIEEGNVLIRLATTEDQRDWESLKITTIEGRSISAAPEIGRPTPDD